MKIYGLSRTRDRSGKVIKRELRPYVNCIHTQVGGARDNMEVLIVEVYEDKACSIRKETGGYIMNARQ